MKKINVRVGDLIYISRKDKPTVGNNVVTKMTGNIYFPADECATLITALNDASVALQKANENALSGDHEMVAKADAQALVYNAAANAIMLYVQGKANENPAKAAAIILSAGLSMRKSKEIHIPEAVMNVTALFSLTPQTILVKWKNAKFAKVYDVYMSTDEVTWVLVQSVVGRQMLVSSLTTGMRYYFKVVAKNVNGVTDSPVVTSCIAA